MDAKTARSAAIGCFAIAGAIALYWLFSGSTPKPAPAPPSDPSISVTAPVGTWSDQIHIPAYRCVVWNPMPTAETFRVQTYWNSVWSDYIGGKVDASHFRIQSTTQKPLPVTVTFKPAGTC